MIYILVLVPWSDPSECFPAHTEPFSTHFVCAGSQANSFIEGKDESRIGYWEKEMMDGLVLGCKVPVSASDIQGV